MQWVRSQVITAAHGFTQETHNGDDIHFSKSLELGEVCTPKLGHLQHFDAGCGTSFWKELNSGPLKRTQTDGRGVKRSVGLDNNTLFLKFFVSWHQTASLFYFETTSFICFSSCWLGWNGWNCPPCCHPLLLPPTPVPKKKKKKSLGTITQVINSCCSALPSACWLPTRYLYLFFISVQRLFLLSCQSSVIRREEKSRHP